MSGFGSGDLGSNGAGIGIGGIVFGTAVGVALAFAGLAFGFWGFLLVLLLGAIGGVVGAVSTGRLDLRAAASAARGNSRRVG